MSRIYEALQKAESERKAEREAPLGQSPVHEDLSSHISVAEAIYSQPIGVTERLEESPRGISRDAVAFELDRIARYPWSPSLEKLPALMERGYSVEQFRSLRSRLFELRDIKPLKSILISSGLPQEGKSFIAANLAVSLARHKNSKVLLIDGDMRRYTLHELLGCESHPGLADYLAGRVEMFDVMQRAQPSDIEKENSAALPNLTFIPGGNGGDKAADLSGNPRFAELIKIASTYFDWIVVDSSPVLPVSDAGNLARACDGVLLVARNGVTKFQTAQRAQSELKASNILGFVLNAAESSPHIGNYYGYDSSNT
jgi:protein-tyrosine kinase